MYLISPRQEVDWSPDCGEFAALLERSWPGITVKVTSPHGGLTSCVEWRVPIGGHELLGFLLEAQKSVSLSGDLVATMVFAVWFRAHVPDDVPLLVYHESYETKSPLDVGMRVDETLLLFLADAD